MSEKIVIDDWKKWYPKSIKKNISLKQHKKNDQYEELSQKYYDKGFKVGLKEGYKLQLKKKEFDIYIEKIKLQNKMKDYLDILKMSFQNFDAIIVEKLLKIALKISSQICNSLTHINELDIKKNIKMMLSKTILSKKIIFKINKNDKKFFKYYVGKLISSYDYLIYYDSNVKSGECIIELEHETLDSTSYTKWKELCRLFVDR